MGTHPIFESDFDCLTDMKLFSMCALVGLSYQTKLRFGGNQCEYGPSFWCENIRNSNQCDATNYCVKNEWNAPTSPDNVCETCKTAVGLVHMYLTDNKTREEVEGVLDYACQVVPDGKLKDDCFKLIQDESNIIFDFIAQVTNPEVICSAIQLCSAASEEDLLNLIEKKVSEMPVAQVDLTTDSEVDENDTVEELKPIPIDISSPKLLQKPKFDASFKGTGCDICKIIVSKIDEALEDEKNEGQIMDAVETACNALPSEYSDQCKAAVEMYGPQIIKMLEAQLVPGVICSTLGLCEQLSSWKLPSNCALPKQVGMCRALMPSFFYNIETQKCEYFGYGGCGGNSNRFDSQEECEAKCVRAYGMDACQDCKLAVMFLKNYIEDPENAQSVVQALDKVCDQVPSSFVMECQDMVDTYGTAMIEYADQLMDPNFVCEKMKLCPSKADSKVVPAKGMLVGANACTFGPSHWCLDHDTAKECKATEYCLEKGLLEPEK